MNTSYFAKYKGKNGISISGQCPDWFEGREYKKLAPKYWFFKRYKDKINNIELYNMIKADYYDSSFIKDMENIKMNMIKYAENEYIENYQKEVLDKLNAKTVYEELGEDAVLLCWENTEKFCHRHLVAKWLENELGVEITELEIPREWTLKN